jgi:hypothetical protein
MIIVYWKPYEMYCLSRLDTDLEVPEWCWEEMPNVYSYVQKKYWTVGFLESFKREPYLILVSMLSTNFAFFYIAFRFVSSHGLFDFVTLSLFKTHKAQVEQVATNVFTNRCLTPHFWVMFANLMIVLFYANIEINARVASTCIYYYIGLSQLIVETHEELSAAIKNQSELKLSPKHFVVMITMAYNVIVMFINPLIFSVGIGFV